MPAFFAVSTYPKRAAQVVVVRVAARGGAFDAMEAATGQTGGSNLLSLQGGVPLVAGIFQRLAVASGHTRLGGTLSLIHI